MMKLYSAISPSMNDQWSGKTLFSDRRAKLAAPSRSSNQLNSRRITASPPSLLSRRPVPEARSHRLREVAGGSEESRAVRVDVQLRQGPGRGAEHHLGAVQHVEGRLMARALQLVEGREVQAHRAASVRADLRVADVA